MFLAVQAGYTAKDVYILADGLLHKDAMTIIEIVGLTPSDDAARIGFFVIFKTRAGNMAFWNWYFTNVVVNFIQDCRGHLTTEQVGDLTTTFNLSCDGEEIMTAVQMEPEIMHELRVENANLSKGSASCSCTWLWKCFAWIDLNFSWLQKRRWKHFSKMARSRICDAPLRDRIVSKMAAEHRAPGNTCNEWRKKVAERWLVCCNQRAE